MKKKRIFIEIFIALLLPLIVFFIPPINLFLIALSGGIMIILITAFKCTAELGCLGIFYGISSLIVYFILVFLIGIAFYLFEMFRLLERK